MGNSEPSNEEIRKWINEGWKFGSRKKKGHIYITRRLGPNMEKSYGRFTQELWDRIKKVESSPIEPVGERESKPSLHNYVEISRIIHYTKNCTNIDDNGYCTYWKLKPNSSFINYPKPLSFKEIMDGGQLVWMFRANRRFCKDCHAFVSSAE